MPEDLEVVEPVVEPAAEPEPAVEPVPPLASIGAGLDALDERSEPVTEPTPEPTPDPAPAAREPESEGAKAARLLAEQYKTLPGVVADVIGGHTVEEVQASLEKAKSAYSAVREAVVKEMSDRVPAARSGGGPVPAPATSIGKISAGLAAADSKGRR